MKVNAERSAPHSEKKRAREETSRAQVPLGPLAPPRPHGRV